MKNLTASLLYSYTAMKMSSPKLGFDLGKAKKGGDFEIWDKTRFLEKDLLEKIWEEVKIKKS